MTDDQPISTQTPIANQATDTASSVSAPSEIGTTISVTGDVNVTDRGGSGVVSSTSDERTVNNSDDAVRHHYRVLSDDEKALMVEIKDAGANLLELIDKLPDTYRTQHARIQAEGAVMFAVKELTT